MNEWLKVLIVLLPLGGAIAWVIFNIGSAAIQQGQDFLDKE